MRVIATAGHVDHGKSKLVEAITGTHPDRLQEERDRGLTIVLGFAWFTTPEGEDVGIVDVPGHRDFIENMLSGVGSIDGVIFVVAADEGVMPQTREHLAILDLLGVPGGVIAMTKTDLDLDPDWFDLVEADIRDAVQGTVLEDADIVRVSAKNGTGINTVIEKIDHFLSGQKVREDLGRPRLSVDRAFSVQGFGTVVTGTLLDGALNIGDEIVVLPQGLSGRIRGLQSHKQKVEQALPGSRTAINISGIAVDNIDRGNVISHHGAYKTSRRIDVRARLLGDISAPLKHDSEIKFFVGAAEVIGRVRVLGREQLSHGESGYLQIELREPIVVNRQDRFILRRPSPGETIGGGEVINPHPRGRYRRFDEDLISMLENIHEGSLEDQIYHYVHDRGRASVADILDYSKETMDAVQPVIGDLEKNGRLVVLRKNGKSLQRTDVILGVDYFTRLLQRVRERIDDFHSSLPLRIGIVKEEVRTKLRIDPQVFERIVGELVASEEYVDNGLQLMNVHHEIEYSDAQKKSIQKLMTTFEQADYQPPSVKECIEVVGEEVYQSLLEQAELRQVSQDVVFREAEYQEIIDGVRRIIQADGGVTVGQVRDEFNTSRKYVLAVLEYMDSQGITKRVGDIRKLRSSTS